MLTLAAADTLAGVASAATKVTYTLFGMELAAGVETYKALAQGQLAAAAATIYTAPASTQAFVKTIMLVNTDASNSVTFTLYRGGTAAANQATPVYTIPAGGMAIYEDGDGWQFLDNLGQLLQRPAVSPILTSNIVADSANQTSTTEAVIATLAIPANFCLPGSTFAFEIATSCAQGAVAQTTPGAVYNLRWGGLAGVLIATAAIITPATLLAASPGYVRGFLTIRTTGATGTVKGGLLVGDPRGTRAANTEIPVKAGKSGAAATIDTTAAKSIDLCVKATAADASFITFAESALISCVRQ